MRPILTNGNDQVSAPYKLNDDILTTVTHELRTPLTSIRAVSGILHDNPDLEIDQRDQFLDIILEESERLTHLVEDMLDLAELELGKAEWKLSRINIVEVIDEALAATDDLLRSQHIQVQFRLPEVVPPVIADRNRIKRVIISLLTNAVKFCDENAGWIGIRLRVWDDAIQIDISDNGIGINASKRHKISDEETNRQMGHIFGEEPQTTNLGLLVGRYVVNHLGGNLWFEKGLNHGATFSFTLPLYRSAG
ncbi:MAG: HAMP domain-containing histidine kinase [Anaerolineae bacterium]|nr:HAMP domain-containing histidine kinase [Anaerolineae bacterium]